MPFVQSLAKTYDTKSTDITVEAGGSGFGIQQVAKGFADIGDASKNPYSAVKEELQTE
jgi:ABC-type phosphate transport system substrate-binding protein